MFEVFEDGRTLMKGFESLDEAVAWVVDQKKLGTFGVLGPDSQLLLLTTVPLEIAYRVVDADINVVAEGSRRLKP